jgi:hypothetical protein
VWCEVTENPYDALGVAAHRILRLQRELEEARLDRDRALRGIYALGVRKCDVSTVAWNNLTLHGFSADDLARIGISPGSVRVALDRPRAS